MLVDQDFSNVLEKWKDIFVDILQILENSPWWCFDDIFWLWHSNSLKLDSSLIFDLLNQLVSFFSVESNASTGFTSSGSSSWSMNVSFSVFWWLDLNDEIDVFDVKSSWSNIGGNQNLEFTFFESLHGDFSLILGNVSVHDFNVLFDLVRQNQRIGIKLGLRENNGFSISSIADEDISKSWHSVLVWAFNS